MLRYWMDLTEHETAAVLGVIKTLHVLKYAHDPAYRRTIHHLLSCGERRNSLARAVFHGQRGQLRRYYQVGQETSSTASAS